MNQTIVTETQETEEKITKPQKVVKKTTVVTPPPLENIHPQKVYKTKKAIFRTYQVIWYILSIVEIILAFRILLRFVGANPSSGFTAFIYALSNPFAVPFLGVLYPSISGNNILEWSTLIAMGVYFLIAWGIIELLQIIKPVEPDEVKEAVDKT